MNRVYYVEDDADIRSLVVYALNATGFEAHGFEGAAGFLAALAEGMPDLILLDVMLAGTNGLELLRQLKEDAKTRHIPVMMITALGAEDDKVNALELGAEDYITKPFGVMELTARIRAMLRRCADGTRMEILQAGRIRMDEGSHSVSIDDAPVQLTLKEYTLLRMLMENEGRLVDRERLIHRVWGDGHPDANHTLDAHMRTLRSKLGDAGKCIRTVYGRGYRLLEETR